MQNNHVIAKQKLAGISQAGEGGSLSGQREFVPREVCSEQHKDSLFSGSSARPCQCSRKNEGLGQCMGAQDITNFSDQGERYPED